MSMHFAIPATTFILKTLIEKRLKKAYGNFDPRPITTAPPPRPPASAQPGAQAEDVTLTLYMHHATTNASWRNMHDPQVDREGRRIANAPLVLDLHYMLTAYGSDLEREALLGIGMGAMHRNGILARPLISALLDGFPPPNPLAKFMDGLTGERLDEPAKQPESITITQQSLDLDMSTKLWSALQSPMRPSAYYLVTTVFLDSGDEYPQAKLVKTVNVSGAPTDDPKSVGKVLVSTGDLP